jgi:glycosyltransferase involved in cell wall biosynthesis
VGAVSEAKELESLKLVHKAIEQLRHKGLEIEWTIYSSPAWEKNIEQHLLGPPWVRFGGCVSELPAVLAEADLLLLALNFDELSRRYLGVSIQNKVPEYMASGTPVLAVGPADNPSIDYAKRERWGLVVDRPDVNQIEIALQQLHQDGDLRRQLGILARDLAIKNHGRAATQQRFVSALHEAIRGG